MITLLYRILLTQRGEKPYIVQVNRAKKYSALRWTLWTPYGYHFYHFEKDRPVFWTLQKIPFRNWGSGTLACKEPTVSEFILLL